MDQNSGHNGKIFERIRVLFMDRKGRRAKVEVSKVDSMGAVLYRKEKFLMHTSNGRWKDQYGHVYECTLTAP